MPVDLSKLCNEMVDELAACDHAPETLLEITSRYLRDAYVLGRDAPKQT